MAIQFQIINPLTFPGWDKLVLGYNGYTFFHSLAWASVLVNSYSFKPFYFAALENGRFSAIIPCMEARSLLYKKIGISLPFSDYCNPLFDSAAAFIPTFNFAIKTASAKNWHSLTIHGNAPFLRPMPPSTFYYRHELKLLQDSKRIYKKFRENTRRNIQRAIKERVAITIETSFDAVSEFYRLNCLTRKRHGLPPQPFSFFENFFRFIIKPGHGIVALARLENRVVSASVFLHFGKRSYYKYGASDQRFAAMRANYLCMWEVIQYYCERGFDALCFGRTEACHNGLLQYKAGWGAEQLTVNNYEYSLRSDSFLKSDLKTNGLHNIFFRNIPVPIAKLISMCIYKHGA